MPIMMQTSRRRPGRPRLGLGAKVISLSVERKLLGETDQVAAELGITRAALISHVLRQMLDQRK